MPTKPVLQVSGLSAVIGRQPILQDVSLSMAPGDWLGVVGGSGAGKTTLLRAIMGLTRPARPVAGWMTVDGQRFDWTGERPAGIGYVPQSPAHGLDPLRRLGWQWRQLARLCGRDDRALFAALDLPEPGAHFPHEWSQGMQQRFLLALALLDRPRLLILDEPTSALDAVIAAQVMRLVQRQAVGSDMAVLMVTHDLALAARFCDQIAIMDQGRVVDSGPADRVLSAPAPGAAQELVAHQRWHRAAHA